MTLRASPFLLISLLSLSLTTPACSRFGAVYPPRPALADAPPVADPAPSKVVAHLTITGDGLRSALEDNVPKTGDGTVHVLGGDRRYTWERGPLDLSFGQGRIEIHTKVQGTLALPLKTLSFPLDLVVRAEPIIDTSYDVKLQGAEVHVTSPERVLAFADEIAGVYSHIEDPIRDKLQDVRRTI